MYSWACSDHSKITISLTILAAWDLRSFYVEQTHQHLVDPRVHLACISISYAPEITLAISKACTSGVDQSVRDMLLEWGTRQVGARAAWEDRAHSSARRPELVLRHSTLLYVLLRWVHDII